MSTEELKSTKCKAIGERLWPIAKLVSVVSVSTTIFTLFARYHWLADLLANLRVQQCLMLLFSLVACLICRKLAWIALALACLVVHLPWFIAAIPERSASDANPVFLKITTTNVLTQNRRHDDIIADILSQAPDVFAVLELSSSLASALDQQLESTYPHGIVRPIDSGNFGIGLYSRHPFIESEVFALNTEILSISATVQVAGKSCRIVATHPLPPMGAEGYQLRNEHLEQLAERIRLASQATPTVPVVLVGDLNLTPWSPHFATLETNSGMRRAFNRLSLTPTWYRYPLFPCGLMLDHALISETLCCRSHVVGPEVGSDHRSVTVELTITDDYLLAK